MLTPDVRYKKQRFYWKSKKTHSSAAGEDNPLFQLPLTRFFPDPFAHGSHANPLVIQDAD